MREAIFLDEIQIQNLIPQIKLKFHCSEMFILSTCNRFEIFGVTSQNSFSTSLLEEIIWNFHFLSGKKKIEKKKLLSVCHFFHEKDAVSYLFSIVAGLKSMVVGETQIVGQFKESFQNASKQQCLGPILNKLNQQALTVSKKIRANTEISKNVISYSHMAIDLANLIFKDFSQCTFVFIGVGEMTRIALQHTKTKKTKKSIS